MSTIDNDKLDQIVTKAHTNREKRLKGYREQSLKIHPWICGRCGREFDRSNLHELTVHHKDHNHDNNPADGSNWENLCIYCHDNEHSRQLDHLAGGDKKLASSVDQDKSTHKPFKNLKKLLQKKE